MTTIRNTRLALTKLLFKGINDATRCDFFINICAKLLRSLWVCSTRNCSPARGATSLTKEQILSAHAAWYLRRADTVVLATVLNSVPVPNKVPFTKFQISIVEVIKGAAVPHTMTLETGADNCSLHLNKDEKWLLFVRKAAELNICSGSTKLDPMTHSGDAQAFLKEALSSAH